MTLEELLMQVSMLFHKWDELNPTDDLPDWVDNFWSDLTDYLEKEN